MNPSVRSFAEVKQEERPLAGGKGGTLAHLYQRGYPVPDGFVILPSAFIGDQLSSASWGQAQEELSRLRNGSGATSFAVRSSALSEDSAQASFAGEFETVLDVHSDEMIRERLRRAAAGEKNMAAKRAAIALAVASRPEPGAEQQ